MTHTTSYSRVVLLSLLAAVLAASALMFANGSSSDSVPLRDLAGNALNLADSQVAPVGNEQPTFTQSAAVGLVRERYPGVEIYKTSLISFTALPSYDARLAWAVLIDPASAGKLIACDNQRACPTPGPGYVTVVIDAQTGQVLIVAEAVVSP